MRGQSAEMVFNGFAGDMLTAVVAPYVQGQDFTWSDVWEHKTITYKMTRGD